MNDSIKQLTERVDRLRADLAATNLALAATATVLTPEQRQQVLQAIAKASAQRQATYEQIPIAEEKLRSAVQLFQEAEGRIYGYLQGAPEQFGKG